jgi:hypothetical protein
MHRFIFLIFCLFFALCQGINAQKMLIVSEYGRIRNHKLYIGDELQFRLREDGRKKYWYRRTISDILPKDSLLVMDGFPTRYRDIAAIRLPRRRIWRLVGGQMIASGGSLVIAATGVVLYGDRGYSLPLLYGSGVAGIIGGFQLLKPRQLVVGRRCQLHLVEF